MFKDLYKLQINWSKNLYSDLIYLKMSKKDLFFLDFLAILSMNIFQNLISSAMTANTSLCQIS
jgi:hypothetical protein